jgi:hypothetical protein
MRGIRLFDFILIFNTNHFMEVLYYCISTFVWLVVLKVIEELLSRRYKSKWLCFTLAFIITMILVAVVSYLFKPILSQILG